MEIDLAFIHFGGGLSPRDIRRDITLQSETPCGRVYVIQDD
jgi:hypothetical protein